MVGSVVDLGVDSDWVVVDAGAVKAVEGSAAGVDSEVAGSEVEEVDAVAVGSAAAST